MAAHGEGCHAPDRKTRQTLLLPQHLNMVPHTLSSGAFLSVFGFCSKPIGVRSQVVSKLMQVVPHSCYRSKCIKLEQAHALVAGSQSYRKVVLLQAHAQVGSSLSVGPALRWPRLFWGLLARPFLQPAYQSHRPAHPGYGQECAHVYCTLPTKAIGLLTHRLPARAHTCLLCPAHQSHRPAHTQATGKSAHMSLVPCPPHTGRHTARSSRGTMIRLCAQLRTA